jgi:hypothetical protein
MVAIACAALLGVIWPGTAAQSRALPGLRFSFAAEGPHGGERVTVLRIAGDVADGDLERLHHFLRKHPQDFIDHGARAVFVVDGGDLEEAIRIGRFL